MARTGQQENQTANTEDAAQKNQSFATGQGAIAQYQKNEALLNSGGQVAANPWKSADYLGNVNRAQAGALNSETGSGDAELRQLLGRTGGLNTGATQGAITQLKLQKERLGDDLSANRAAQDFGKNVGYQQEQAAAPLNVTSSENGTYGSAIGGQNSALGNLTQYGLASYGPINSLIGAVGTAAGGYLGGLAKKGG